MKHRKPIYAGLIILFAAMFIQVVLAAPGDNNSPFAFYEVELFNLRKKGTCDSSKYTITNIGSSPAETDHYFYRNDGTYEYSFSSSIGAFETEEYDLSSMVSIADGFTGYLVVISTEEITGTVLPFPPCDISIEGPLIGTTNTIHTFTANVTPEDVLLPITYSWVEYDIQTVIHVSGINDSVEFFWTTSGWKQIFLTAQNSRGSITKYFWILIQDTNQIYLPIALR